MASLRTDRGASGPNLEGNSLPGEIRLQFRIVGVSNMEISERYPQRPRRLSQLPLILFALDCDDIRRIVELCFQGADVLVDERLFDDVAVHLRERCVSIRNA